MTMKPFAESCEQNKHPILAVLREEFALASEILEIGSGTGQHAVFFANALPHLHWQTSDCAENHPGILAWLNENSGDNVHLPLTLDVSHDPWPRYLYDGIFSANTVHIMGWAEVEKLFEGVGQVLAPGGRFCLYGPFNRDGKFTSESNAHFDVWLKQRDPKSGIRDRAELDELAQGQGLQPVADHEMPANNRILVWQR
ncbi:MAG: class I SAM-dependent methyltransferase [Gammaproteobacteria bacterium]|nr:class I SAM-dependent methyltransferase [Gammaproteobacteria bacterium]